MTLIVKPDYSKLWASGGAIVEPTDTKKQLGWTAEVPPHQWENWVQNRQDQFIAHVNQRGVPGWDALTEYEVGGLSYVQGTDGKVYKSVTASGPSTTTQDPVTDVAATYWEVAFAGLVSPLFTGSPTAPTPAQFDNDSSIATTGFVQRALGSYNGCTVISVSRSLGSSDIGKAVFVTSGGWQITAPTPSSIDAPIGAAVTFLGTVGTNSTMVPGSGALIKTARGSVPSVSLKTGQSLTLVAVTNSNWQVLNSTATLGENESFATSLATTGYQKLPSGLIIQWGAVPPITAGGGLLVTHAIAFTSGVYAILPGSGASLSGSPTISGQAVSITQTRFWNNSNSMTSEYGSYLIIGY